MKRLAVSAGVLFPLLVAALAAAQQLHAASLSKPTGVNPGGSCPSGDANGDGEITIDEVLVAVSTAQSGRPP